MHPSLQKLGVDLSADFDNVQRRLVKDVIELYNDSIRRTLSTTLGRSMQRSKGGQEVAHTVKIEISDDYPTSLKQSGLRYGTDLLTAFRLLVQLQRVAEATAYISENGELVHQLQAAEWLAGSSGSRQRVGQQPDLNMAFAMGEVNRLKAQLAPFAAEIHQALYEQSLSMLSAYEPNQWDTGGRVVLYWKAVAMVAADLDAETHDIARYALLHGLTHAYCHLAMDTNHNAWHLYRFSENAVREGVAGWYTHNIISGKDYGLRKAYVKLMNKIPLKSEQLTWQRWYDEKCDNEKVRLAMQRSNEANSIRLADFERLLS